MKLPALFLLLATTATAKLAAPPKLGATSPRAVVPKAAAPVAKALSGGAAASGETFKLLFGAGGIYAAFLYYGSLQEDVFRYVSADGAKFKEVWFLQVLEAACNVAVGFAGLCVTSGTKGLPQKLFALSGASQVLAKYCTNAALANGLSFPVATLAKSGKMVPVMAGSLLLGGATYSARQYAQVAMIVAGTAVVGLSKKKAPGGGAETATAGLVFIASSLAFDGVTGGVQKRVKQETAARGVRPKPYDFMFWTNAYMLATALAFAAARGECGRGLAFCLENPAIWGKILRFGACSAVGQSFIFYTIAHFDPLVCSTVTTTRKIFSVLISILFKGHTLSLGGWGGVALASAGILADAAGKKH
jgi:UDP-galactose transporter B1